MLLSRSFRGPFSFVSRITAFVTALIAARVFSSEWRKIRRNIELLQNEHCLVCNSGSYIAQKMLISAEDERFFLHSGFDIIALFRATWRLVSCKKLEGASTIEMQIVRVLTGHYEITVYRKIREVMLATLLKRVADKESLLSVYLTIGYFGYGMRGFDAAWANLYGETFVQDVKGTAGVIARLRYPQPRHQSKYRMEQIEKRTAHICKLYLRHSALNTYYLLPDIPDDSTVHGYNLSPAT